jgi:putative N6-adenine-specific DNA methylase
VNDLLVQWLVHVLQVRNVQGAHSFDGHHQRFISTTVPSYVLSRGPQDTEDLRPIKSLPFTMLAEAHGVPHPGRIPPILDETRVRRVNAQRCNDLRLTGSGGANRVMEAELKRLVMRSPFDVRLDKPKREGEETLLYTFDARVAWVAACHHRTSSRISWDLCSSPAVRLEPLFAGLLSALSSDDRLPDGKHLRFSVEVGSSSDFEASPLQLRGVVKNALVEALASRGVASDVDGDAPDVVFVARRAGTPDARRTVVGIDVGGGARHRRGARVAAGLAPLRETLAAQLIMLSRWDARTEPLVDPMAGSATIPIEAAGLAVGAAIRHPADLPLRHLAAFRGLPNETPDLFPGPWQKSSRSTPTPSAFPRWWATCAPRL